MLKNLVMHSTMNTENNDQIKGTLIVPLSLILVLIPYSMLIGWNLFTAILFWLVITPALTIYLPMTISKNKDHLVESLVGLAIFYALMVFMIYEHYKTDYYFIMMLSLVVNMMVVLMVYWVIRHRKPIGKI